MIQVRFVTPNQCPCCSGKPYRICCETFHSGRQKPRTVKQLMRSRYCAFAVGGLGDYLLHTWHPSSRPTLTAAELDGRDTAWVQLKILRDEQSGDRGIVEFIASYRSEEGDLRPHHETSEFAREKGTWLYVNGELHSTVDK